MSDTYYDGSYSTRGQHGPTIINRDPVTLARMVKRTMRVYKDDYAPLAIGAEQSFTVNGDTFTAYLHSESEPKHVDAGILEIDELYTEVPATRSAPESIAYAYQFYDGENILEYAIPVAGIALYSYGLVEYGTDASNMTLPDSLAVHVAPRMYKMGDDLKIVGDVLYNGTDFPAPSWDDNPVMLARDSELSQWRGLIWQRKEVFVNKQNLKA